ncbi:hypothetical protein OCK74_10655 [Chitinophagaceae bacterium LB-8]|uniref:Uncharacterized protein n=1 Tax=Paraflavisolibacter caeni TaxID=2982496 RepID=A0A9X3BHG3_9BACT|nr:hypothetical protein [Paraflavisolibacter caeni]MCU7549577.1 hypothetical protein [Paraflavisolibacter caeni]
MNLDNIIKKYQALKSDPFAVSNLIFSLPHKEKVFKTQLLELIQNKIRDQDSEDLGFYLSLAYWDGIDESYKPALKGLIQATWHTYHEDIIESIFELKDDAFTDDLYKIAITPDPYRQYDDELEATLRKCVHALKAINSSKANERLEQLKATGNKNVLAALEIYH